MRAFFLRHALRNLGHAISQPIEIYMDKKTLMGVGLTVVAVLAALYLANNVAPVSKLVSKG